MLLARDEAEVCGLFPDMARYQPDAAVQPDLAVAGLGEDRTDHPVQALQRLLDQGHAERGDVVEVPVEGRGRDPHGTRHLAQAEAAQALVFQQPEGGVEQGLARLQLLALTDADGVTHAIQ